MIYDDQPQMVEAFRFEVNDIQLDGSTTQASDLLREAFAAIDREALIEKVAEALGESDCWERRKGYYRSLAEFACEAGGIIQGPADENQDNTDDKAYGS